MRPKNDLHTWPRFSLRTSLIVVAFISCAVAALTASDRHLASIHGNIETKLTDANSRLADLQRQLREHKCQTSICSVVFCGSTSDGSLAPIGDCTWTKWAKSKVSELQEEATRLGLARKQSELNQREYRVRSRALFVPAIVMIVAAFPVGWFASHQRS